MKMAVINLSLNNADKTLLLNLGENNIRFVTAKSLTKMAQNVQEAVKKHIAETFIIRRKSGGFIQSIKILPAKKQNLQAKVYTMAGFAALQQTGGRQKALSGRLAVPAYKQISDVKSRTSANKPRGLKKSFLLKLSDGSHAIAVRTGKDLKVMYYLKPEAYLPKRLNMIEIGENTAEKFFTLEFHKNMQELLA